MELLATRENLSASPKDLPNEKVNNEKREEQYLETTRNIPGMIYKANEDWSVDFMLNSEYICGYSPEDFESQKVNLCFVLL